MAKGTWHINKWYGGLSTGSKSGPPGSFRFGHSLNYRNDPDMLTTNFTMVKDSAAVVTDLCKWFATDVVNSDLYGYSTAGKLYLKDGGTATWSSIRSVTSSTGQGLAVFNDYLYYARTAFLGRYGALSGGAAFDDTYQTLTSDSYWHPMKVFLNKLCIGNGRTLATLDSSGTWTSSQITLPIGWSIKCMEVSNGTLYMGAWRASANLDDYQEGAIFTWDGVSTSSQPITSDFFNESGVNSLFNFGKTLYVFPGMHGKIYQLQGSDYAKLKTIPITVEGVLLDAGNGPFGPGIISGAVAPNACSVYDNTMLFGYPSDPQGYALTEENQGIFSWSQIEKNYPYALNLEYLMSTGNGLAGDETAAENSKVGTAMAVLGNDLYISWEDQRGGSAYGVDRLRNTTKAVGIFESLVFDAGDASRNKTFTAVRVVGGATVVVKYKVNRDVQTDGWITLPTTSEQTDTDLSLYNQHYKRIPMVDGTYGPPKAREIQIRVEITDAQEHNDGVSDIYVDFEMDDEE